jgi:hypothetical protein
MHSDVALSHNFFSRITARTRGNYMLLQASNIFIERKIIGLIFIDVLQRVFHGSMHAYGRALHLHIHIYRHPDLTQQDAQTADYKYNNVL